METRCLERENVFTILRGKFVWFFQKVRETCADYMFAPETSVQFDRQTFANLIQRSKLMIRLNYCLVYYYYHSMSICTSPFACSLRTRTSSMQSSFSFVCITLQAPHMLSLRMSVMALIFCTSDKNQKWRLDLDQ